MHIIIKDKYDKIIKYESLANEEKSETLIIEKKIFSKMDKITELNERFEHLKFDLQKSVLNLRL